MIFEVRSSLFGGALPNKKKNPLTPHSTGTGTSTYRTSIGWMSIVTSKLIFSKQSLMTFSDICLLMHV